MALIIWTALAQRQPELATVKHTPGKEEGALERDRKDERRQLEELPHGREDGPVVRDGQAEVQVQAGVQRHRKLT